MSLANQITKQSSYEEFLKMINEHPSKRLDNCFATGLPAVWLYMKAIGLEAEYFALLNSVKDRSFRFKELFYLLLLTSSNSNFFPQIPKDLLKIEIAPDMLAAQVEIAKPNFQLCFTFNIEQLESTLQALVSQGRMIQIGNKQASIGLMSNGQDNSSYHAGNTSVTTYDTIEKCAEAILRLFPEQNGATPALFVQATGLQNMRLADIPSDLEIFKKLCKSASEQQLQAIAYMAVQAGSFAQLQHLNTLNVDFNHLYLGNIDLLTLAVSQPKANLQLIEFFMNIIDPVHAIEHLQTSPLNRNDVKLQELFAKLTGRPLVFAQTAVTKLPVKRKNG